jgi:hypothetical protein
VHRSITAIHRGARGYRGVFSLLRGACGYRGVFSLLRGARGYQAVLASSKHYYAKPLKQNFVLHATKFCFLQLYLYALLILVAFKKFVLLVG